MRRAAALACLGGAALACVAGATLAAAGARRPQAPGGGLRVEPQRAAIGVFYHGARLTISGTVDSGTAVAVLLTGPAGDLPLRTQARMWGTFWAPAGRVTFEHIPVAYQLATSAALGELAPAATLRALEIGYDAFRPDTSLREGAAAGPFFSELIRLKETERLFRTSIGAVRFEPAAPGRRSVAAALELPARAPPATYRVQLFGFRDGRLVLREEGAFTISRGVFNAVVTRLARDQGLVYGIVAVVVAVAAGLLVGLAFGSVQRH